MKTYLDCWISAATMLFSQALAGEPQLTEMEIHPADGFRSSIFGRSLRRRQRAIYSRP